MSISRATPKLRATKLKATKLKATKLKAMAVRTRMPAIRRFHDHAIAVTMVGVAAVTFAALVAVSFALAASTSPYVGGLVAGVGIIAVLSVVWMSARRPAPRLGRRQRHTPGCRRRQMNRTWPVNATPRPLPVVERRSRTCRPQRHR